MTPAELDRLPEAELLPQIRSAVRRGADLLAVQFALARGVRDENQITNLLFHARHPERRGASIRPAERALAAEWRAVRDVVVRPALRRTPAAPAAATATATAGGATASGALLQRLGALSGRDVAATVAHAEALVKLLSEFWQVPWRVPFTILEHEGGVRLFRHPDGVMQTIRSARATILPSLPRAIKRTLLQLPPDDTSPDATLAAALHREFGRRLAVQVAAGICELVTNLRRFNGYVALAFVAYNAGAGSAYHVATGRSVRAGARPTGAAWEQVCLQGASLLHQAPGVVDVKEGVWQCDENLARGPGQGWYRKFEVRDRRTGRLLIAYQYLRSVQACIRVIPPSIPCEHARHKQRQPGSGQRECKATRFGALDTLYDPRRLSPGYRQAGLVEPLALIDDGSPLRATALTLAAVPPSLP